jgi:hypothetical protein
MELKIPINPSPLISIETITSHGLDSHISGLAPSKLRKSPERSSSGTTVKKLSVKQKLKEMSYKLDDDYFEYEDGYHLKKTPEAVEKAAEKAAEKANRKKARKLEKENRKKEKALKKAEEEKVAEEKKAEVSSKKKRNDEIPQKNPLSKVQVISEIKKIKKVEEDQEDIFNYDSYQIKKKTVA